MWLVIGSCVIAVVGLVAVGYALCQLLAVEGGDADEWD